MKEAGKTRKSLRIESTKEEPITVAFRQPEMKKFENRIEVKDISAKGLGLRVPLGIRYLKEGMTIEDMEIRLPGAIKCIISGRIVYKRLGQCGIQFLNSNPLEQRKLEAFVRLRGEARAKV